MVSLIKEVNKEKFILYLMGLCCLAFSCAGKPKAPPALANARLLETKAQIKNRNETNTVKIQIALWPQRALRMEVTATLGVSVATVLMTPKQIQILIPHQKTFIQGPFHEKTLYPVFKQNISPRLIWKIIHAQNPVEPGLQCQFNTFGQPSACQSTSDASTVEWTYNEDGSKRIDLKRDLFEMAWIFKAEMALTTDQNETFVLKKPDDYKEIDIK